MWNDQRKLAAICVTAVFAGWISLMPGQAGATPCHLTVSTPCILEPGIYPVVDENNYDELVAILIVYPDCEIEVVKVPTDPAI